MNEALEGQSSSYFPYPNPSCFQLGDWYWTQGLQKSLADFRRLRGIISHPEFSSKDVRVANWKQIDQKLGSSSDEGWFDDLEDTGWKRTPISISVPFHPRQGHPTLPTDVPRPYIGGDLFHRNLVSVIKEKVSNADHMEHFHYEPYELFWGTSTSTEPLQVFSEVYNSTAFLDEHRKILSSPGEPGCTLQRVIVALMFWSDATHLTSFGNAKLWPLYLFFGNESKYRRCQPSLGLCTHIAYFQHVSFICFLALSRTEFP